MKRHIVSGAITRTIAGVVGMVLALVLAGCSELLSPIEKNVSAPGKGAVQVSVGDGAVRTLLPDSAALAYYTLAFTKDTQTVNGVISSGVSGSFELDAGTWNLTVKGFLNESAASNADNALASGSVSGIVVTAGGTTPATVQMAFTNGETGSGTLSYSVTFPADTTSATLSAAKISGGTTTKNLLTSSDGNTVSDGDPKIAAGAPSLDAGYYQITVTLSKDDGATRAIKTEIAHISDGLSTELAYAFTSADFFSTYTVSGTIAKSSGDAALTGAAITLKSSRGTDVGTITQPDDDGAYNITGVPAAGDYTLAVSLAGYETKSVTVTGTSSAVTQDVGLSRVINVTSNADSGAGSLRQALADAGATGETPDIIRVDAETAAGTITLSSTLTISNSGDALYLEIEGNGVTVSGGGARRILTIGYSGIAPTVTIRRVRFDQGKGTSDNGGAIYIFDGTVSLESCIFSGNQASYSSPTYGYGGAISKSGTGTLTVKGSTFYNNSATNYGGAIYRTNGTLSLTGNLFYGNTAPSNSVTINATSSGYNVSDKASGTDATTGSGWTFDTGDVQITSQPLAPANFKLLSGDAVGRLPSPLPEGYPATDFYGNAITASGNAGAVQATAAAGYILSYTASGPGTVEVTEGAPNADGLYNGSVTLTANFSSPVTLDHWVKDGADAGNADSLTFILDAHTTVQAVFVRVINITTNTGTASGSLPYAITNAQDGDTIVIQSSLSPITLTATPTLTKSVTIEGNGATISGNNTVGILTIGSSSIAPTVTIRRVRFDQGKNANGGAIYVYGTVSLESCIFSGNQGSLGGAIYMNSTSTLTIKGSTFYNNIATSNGGAIYKAAGTISLTGNLFYGNTALTKSVISGTATSSGYNVSDNASGIDATTSGWYFATRDVQVTTQPLVPSNFKLLSGTNAVGRLNSLPEGYPATDFYGNEITAIGNAGAVQAVAEGGYVLYYTASSGGTVAVTSGTANDDDLYTGSVTLSATPTTVSNVTGIFDHWVKNGADAGTTNPLTFTMEAHTTVQAVFKRTVTVTNVNGTNTDNVSLRWALYNAADGDTITLGTANQTITLQTALPAITKSVTIEGNGVTIAGRDYYKITIGSDSVSPTVTIRGVRFDHGKERSGAYGGGLRNYGITTLESCIFSSNTVAASSGSGGAIANDKTLTVTGCTFYNNTLPDNDYGGAAIYQGSSTELTITGNLFYGNLHNNYPVIWNNGGTVTSGGYNVSDKASGTDTGTSGWTFVATDKTFSDLSISDAPIGTTTCKPLTAKLSALQIVPTDTDGFPATDFGGEARTVVSDKTAAGAWSTAE